SFLYECPLPLRALPAFPTRRSSDLAQEPSLEHLVGARADARDERAGVERRLLHLVVVVLRVAVQLELAHLDEGEVAVGPNLGEVDRKSTRLNSSHVKISYAVFCLKK